MRLAGYVAEKVVDEDIEEGELEHVQECPVAEVKAFPVTTDVVSSGEEEVASEEEEQLAICVQARLASLRRQNRRQREERARLRVKDEVKEVKEVWGCSGCARPKAKVMEVKG